MSIDFTITQQDFAAYMKCVKQRLTPPTRTTIKKAGYRIFIAILITIAVVFYKMWKTGNSIDDIMDLIFLNKCLVFLIAGFFTFAIVLVIYLNYLGNRMTQAMISDDSPFLGDFSIAVEDNGVFLRGEHFESKLSWSMIRSLSEDADYIFLWYDNGVGQGIPKRAFASEAEIRDFLEMVSSKSI